MSLDLITISGIAGSGKSTTAHALGTVRPDYDRVATDNLVAIKRSLDPSDPRIQHSSYLSWRLFGEPTPENRAQGLYAYRDAVRPYLDPILRRADEQIVGMVVEGIHVDPESLLAYDFTNVRPVPVLLSVSEQELHEHMRIKCAYRPALYAHFQENLDHVLALQQVLIDEAVRFGVPIVSANGSIERTVRDIEVCING